MKKYNNISYHSVSISEFQKVLSEISNNSELVMKQFTFVECEDVNPHFRIEFCNFEDVNSNICFYVDFPPRVKVEPFRLYVNWNYYLLILKGLVFAIVILLLKLKNALLMSIQILCLKNIARAVNRVRGSPPSLFTKFLEQTWTPV